MKNNTVKETEFNILSLNTCGFKNKAAGFLAKFKRLKIDIACVQEAGDLTGLNIHGYHMCSTFDKGRIGVGIFSRLPFKKMFEIPKILQGRLCHCLLTDETHIITVYAPSQSTANLQNEEIEKFSQALNDYLRPFINSKLIIAGDFNYAVSNNDRATNTLYYRDVKYGKLLNPILNLHRLIDTFRYKHGNDKSFTFHHLNSASRIDRIYTNFPNGILKVEHIAVHLSDHNGVRLRMRIPEITRRGKGFWKLNVKLLTKGHIKHVVGEFWENWRNEKLAFQNPVYWWEEGKKQLKKLFIELGIEERRKENKTRNDLERELQELYKDQDAGLDNWVKINERKEKLKKMDVGKMEGAKIRGRLNLGIDEKPTAAFFHLEKRNFKTMDGIKNKEGQILEDQSEIAKIIRDYYKDLYSEEKIDNTQKDKFVNNISKKLNEEDRESLEGMISKEEVEQELKAMKSNKSPGIDGLPKEFYKTFFDIIGEDLTEVINNIYFSGIMGETMRTAVITLLFKKGDIHEIKNYRPVSLLTVDYKLITKVLKTRLSKVMASLVHTDQACGVPGRTINDQLLTLESLINVGKKSGGALVAFDLQKAFDRVNHEYMKCVLQKMNIGPYFLKWIKIIYKSPQSRLNINGCISDPFAVKRSVRQGCPLSALLFALCQEPLANAIRNEPNIKGMVIPNYGEVKNVQFADDATHPIRANCINVLLKVYKDFEKASGSLINELKTEILLLGKTTETFIPDEFKKYIVKMAKILGLPWTKEGTDSNKHWAGVITRIRNDIEKWEQRFLSFKGKLLVINTILLSKLWYGGRILAIKKQTIKELNTLIFQFLWSKKRELIRRNYLIRDIKNGGIQMIDIESKCLALRLERIRKLASINNRNDIDRPWVGYGISRFGIKLRGINEYIGRNVFAHNLFAEDVWKELKEHIEKENLPLNRDFWMKKGQRHIYDKLVERKTTDTPYFYTQHQTTNWENVWKNINSISQGGNRDTYYKMIHNGLPLDNKFDKENKKGCPLCKNEAETTNHLFAECEKLRDIIDSLGQICTNMNFGVLGKEDWLRPDWERSKEGKIKTKVCGNFVKAIWTARNSCRAGQYLDPNTTFLGMMKD